MTSANAHITIITDKEQMAAIATAFPKGQTRKRHDTIESAIQTLETLAEKTKDAEGNPYFGLSFGIVGSDKEGNIDTSVYENSYAILAQVRRRVTLPDHSKVEGIVALVVFPIPTMEALIAYGQQGEDFISKVLEKEFSLDAFRPYREVETPAAFMAGVNEAPRSLKDYLESSTNTVDTSTFETLWEPTRDALKRDYAQLWKMLAQLGKGNVLKAIRSKSYAEANPDAQALEEHGIFVKLASQMIAVAEQEGLDTSHMEGWLAARDTFSLSYKAPEKIDVDESYLAGFAGLNMAQ